MLRNKKVLMLISLVIAIGLWAYVMGSVDPVTTERITNIPVTMQGTDGLEKQGLQVKLKSPKTVSLMIEGKRSQVNKTKKKGIEAYVDVSTCDYGKNVGKIHTVLPMGVTNVTMDNISDDTAIFMVK